MTHGLTMSLHFTTCGMTADPEAGKSTVSTEAWLQGTAQYACITNVCYSVSVWVMCYTAQGRASCVWVMCYTAQGWSSCVWVMCYTAQGRASCVVCMRDLVLFTYNVRHSLEFHRPHPTSDRPLCGPPAMPAWPQRSPRRGVQPSVI